MAPTRARFESYILSSLVRKGKSTSLAKMQLQKMRGAGLQVKPMLDGRLRRTEKFVKNL